MHIKTLAFNTLFPVSGSLALLFALGCDPVKPKLPEPTPAAAAVTIETEPAGAPIVIDGVPIGNGPQTVKLNPGPHVLKSTMTGYFPAEQRVMVSGRKPITFPLHLVASH